MCDMIVVSGDAEGHTEQAQFPGMHDKSMVVPQHDLNLLLSRLIITLIDLSMP